ncbi:hypothetical protein QYE76_053977 [Lolium multiflorum]|uniref:Condensin complex subunit 1 C-terminal domain-containing protein n=1 Tax=Lolium multiflorum TaxID=4521 RepID=A0AAD8SWT5_LOLMU|nr:hypothetical protein QYE76_053977 [Lolium multiflorum]
MQKRAFQTMLTGVGRRSGRGERPGRLPRRSAEAREEDGVAVDLVAWEDAVGQSPEKSPSLERKSEVSDLKQQLRQLAGTRASDADDQRQGVFKRVISCMTAGIDVSAAFGEMVLCFATSDVVLKMCYLYDPTILGLALRSLYSLRVPNLVAPLTTGLKDPTAYVQMVAAVGAAKLYHIFVTTCLDADMPAALKALMLSDPDAQVTYEWFVPGCGEV